MNASALLLEMRAAGVTLAATGDRLIVQAAPGIITPQLKARIKALKPQLLAILEQDAAATDDEATAQDLPLLVAVEEFDSLINRLCDQGRSDDRTRALMHATRRRMSPERLLAELPIIRGRLSANDK